jgi:hypothetical protein
MATDVTVPLVVLDIATPPRASERVRQLLARNDFAHQIVALGRIETVLASGLGAPELQNDLVLLLSSGRTVAEVAVELQRTERDTALVTSVRPETMLPLPRQTVR